jgi:nitrite reductase/ring-hydroxylating ferredoxin subunit
MVGDKDVPLIRFAGKYHAPDERCSRRGAPFSEGCLDGGSVACPWHCGLFEIDTYLLSKMDA